MSDNHTRKSFCTAIFAHVDAGKTTVTEQLLRHAGAIRTAGTVDAGTTHTDTLPVERRRGISVKAACVSLTHRDTTIHLIDTPGHTDFAAEVERSFWALDAAVLVVCCAEGVQAQTRVLFSALREQGIPVIFFLNKTDRDGADPQRVIRQIRSQLTDRAIPAEDFDAVTEAVCDADEALFEKYLEGEALDEEEVRQKFSALAASGEVYPLLTGSALKDVGVDRLLDALVEFAPAPAIPQGLSGIVFAATQHRTLGRGVWVRLFGGQLRSRDPLELPAGLDPSTGEPRTAQHKITQILLSDGTGAGVLEPGQIGVVYGLGNLAIGHVLGDPALLPRPMEAGKLRTPLITVQAIPSDPGKMQALWQACDILSGEDPMLQARFIRGLNQLHLQVMGTIQLEVLQEVLESRFGLSVTFTPPAIIYRETISQAAEGHVAYLVPKPCWAILRFRIEPGPRGSGVVFRSQVPVRELSMRYQHQVEQALPLALAQGRLGWQVTDVVITLLEGNSHQYHTHPLDFIVATPMGIQDGLRAGGSTLLEPILEAVFLLPQSHVGRVISDVVTMRGQVADQGADGDQAWVKALIPVATSLDYSITLASFTGGRGSMTVKLHGYRECPLELGATAVRRNVDPLDTSKYILAARSALEGGIFDF